VANHSGYFRGTTSGVPHKKREIIYILRGRPKHLSPPYITTREKKNNGRNLKKGGATRRTQQTKNRGEINRVGATQSRGAPTGGAGAPTKERQHTEVWPEIKGDQHKRGGAQQKGERENRPHKGDPKDNIN